MVAGCNALPSYVQAWASEIEPKALTPKQATDLRRLLQTNSGNLLVAANKAANSLDASCLRQQSPAAPFQLQPRPGRDQVVDIDAMRIMQLQRNISQGSRADLQLQLSAQELADQGSSHSDLILHSAVDMPLNKAYQTEAADEAVSGCEDEYGQGMHQVEDVCMQNDGLYAAAAQVPPAMKAAWKQKVQWLQQGRQTVDSKQKGRSDDKSVLPVKLLRCLQGKTLSDVEAQMHALGVDKHLH